MLEWPVENIAVTNLLLDQENVRIPRRNLSQQELMQDLVDNEGVLEIAKSITDNNYFGHENLIALKSDQESRYVVVEGNRRVAALKVLLQPDIIEGNKKSKIKKLSKELDPKITQVPVSIAPNRNEAEKVIANIHTKDYRRKWKPLREAYFYKRKIDEGITIDELKEEFGGVDIKRWVTMLDMHGVAKSFDLDEGQKKVLHNDRVFPITNLERMYDAKEVRKFLGIEIDSDGKLKGKTDKKEFEKGYKKIVEDVIDGEIDSRSMSNSKSRKKYLKGLGEENTPNTNKDGFFTADAFETEKIKFNKEEHEKEYRKKKKRRSRRTPKGLIPGYVSFNLENSSLFDLFKELRKINVKKCPNAAAVLFCSFLERSLHQYFIEKKVIKKEQDVSLEQLMNLVKARPKSGITDKKAIEAASKNKSKVEEIFTTYSMNAVKHNKDFTISEDQVRGIWNNFEGLLKVILNPDNSENDE